MPTSIAAIRATRVSIDTEDGGYAWFETSLSVDAIHDLRFLASTMYRDGQRVDAIKAVRAVTGCGLKQAKLFCEDAADTIRHAPGGAQ